VVYFPKRPIPILWVMIWSVPAGNCWNNTDNVLDFYVLGRKSGAISETTYSDAIAFARHLAA